MDPKDPDLSSFERKFDELKHDADLKKFDFNTVPSPEQQKLYDALREAKPSALTDGFGIRGPQAEHRRTVNDLRRTDALVGSVSRRQDVPDFPTTSVEQTTTVTTTLPKIAFFVSDASVVEGDPPEMSNKVLVFDGKINGEFPSGMGTGDYIIDLADPDDALIYAGVTFNPTTLAITSRFLGVSTASAFPESRVESPTSGFIYWLLAYTYFDDDGKFTVVNNRVGAIDFAFSYGETNGKPGLLPIDSQPGWLDLDFL